MGFRFRKSFKIAPGVKINLNKKSSGVTFGGKGFHYTVNSNGKRTKSVGIPGSGLYYSTTSGGGSGNKNSGSSGGGFNGYSGNNFNAPQMPNEEPQKNYNTITIILLIFFFPVGLYFMWAKTSWNKVVKIIISAFFALLFIIAIAQSAADSNLPASDSGIQSITIEEESVRLDADDPLNLTKTIEVNYKQNQTQDVLKSDFVFNFSDDDLVSAEIMFLNDYNFDLRITAFHPGTTTLYIETADGKIKSNVITITVLGTPEQSTALTTTEQETTTQETSTAVTTTERETTESTTKDTSRTVYITPSGSKYHYSKSCAGDNAIETTLNQVKDSYEPCKKCAQ